MDFSIEDIRYEIDAKNQYVGTWAIDVRYWLFDRPSATIYYSLPKIYQTTKEMLEFADKVVEQHLRKNGEEILKRLADLAK